MPRPFDPAINCGSAAISSGVSPLRPRSSFRASLRPEYRPTVQGRQEAAWVGKDRRCFRRSRREVACTLASYGFDPASSPLWLHQPSACAGLRWMQSQSEPSGRLRAQARVPDGGFPSIGEAASPKLHSGNGGRETKVTSEASVTVPEHVESGCHRTYTRHSRSQAPVLQGTAVFASESSPERGVERRKPRRLSGFLLSGAQGFHPAHNRCGATLKGGGKGTAIEQPSRPRTLEEPPNPTRTFKPLAAQARTEFQDRN
jgi:hypothetical protein